MTAAKSRNELLAAFFRARPAVWVDGRELEIAGRYGWRSRVSDVRRPPYGLTIENRLRRVRRPDGSAYVVSEYRYLPALAAEAAQGGA